MAHITLSQLTTVLQRIVSWATGKFAAKNTYSGKLEYADMPVVVLASMGSELDGTSTQRPMSAGDTYYLPAGQGAGARIMFVDSNGTAVKISDPVSNVIYCNAYTGLLYRWDASESDMVPVGGDGDGLRKVYVGSSDFSSLDTIYSGVYQVIEQSTQRIIGVLVASSDNKIGANPYFVTQWLFSNLVLSDEYSGSFNGYYTNGRAHIIHRFYNASNSSSDIPLNTWSEWKVYGLTLDEVSELLNAKQDTLTFDNAPTANSNNPVKSGGVYTALAGKQDTISDLSTIRTGAGKGATAIQGIIVGGTEVTPDGNKKVTIPAGADGKSAYQSYLDTTSDSPVKTEAEWVANLLPTVVSNGDMAIVESEDYIDIFIYEAEIATTPTVIALDGEAEAHKSATLNVVGSHLKADIVVSVPTGFYVGSTGTSTSATLTATGGSVNTSVVIRHSGNNPNTDITGVVITLTSGSLTKTVPLSYTRYAGPTIIADAALTVKAAAGGSNTATLSVSGVNLTGNITAAISGTNASKFSVSGSPITQSGGSASGTLTITYSPSSGDTSAADASAILTLSSTGATSIQVALTGKVSELTVSKQSISINTDQSVAATDTFTVSGVNLTEGVTIAKTDTNGVFSVSPSSIPKTAAENSSNTITVTYQSANAGTHTGSLAISSGGVTKTVSLSGTAEAAAVSDAEGKFTKKDANGNTLYLKRVIVNGEKTTDVEVHQSTYNDAWNGAVSPSYTGDVVIPSTVVVDGVTCNVKKLATNSFRNCTGLKSLTLPEGLTHISALSLYQLTNSEFTEITIPSTVISIGGHFLSVCTSLVHVNMLCQENPDFVGTSIDNNKIIWGANYNQMMSGCTKLENMVLPDKVQIVLSDTVNSAPSLKTLVLGTDMEAFNNLLYAFDDATRAAALTIECRGTSTIPVCNVYHTTTMSIPANVKNYSTLKVPRGYKQAYLDKSDPSQGKIWADFQNIVEYDLD